MSSGSITALSLCTRTTSPQRSASKQHQPVGRLHILSVRHTRATGERQQRPPVHTHNQVRLSIETQPSLTHNFLNPGKVAIIWHIQDKVTTSPKARLRIVTTMPCRPDAWSFTTDHGNPRGHQGNGQTTNPYQLINPAGNQATGALIPKRCSII